MHTTYIASLIDAVNGVYNKSGIDIEAQIAGVVWDKNIGANVRLGHVLDSTSVMRRWVSGSILDMYGIDVIILINNPGAQLAQAAFLSQSVHPRRYTGVWVNDPVDVWILAHEMGHVYSESWNKDHCMGQRRTFDAIGNELGGASPKKSFVSYAGKAYPDALIENVDSAAHRGFFTTMAYSTGNNDYFDYYPCAEVISHVYGGVSRSFKFNHHGVQLGPPGWWLDWRPGWTGAYSNPAVLWTDSVTGISYPTGTTDTVYYINRLKYLGGPEVHLDSNKYYRNFSALLNARKDTIARLRSIPSVVRLKSPHGLGITGVDSQWVYAHVAARNSVIIEPGFKVLKESSLRITVGDSGGGLAKRSHLPEASTPRDFQLAQERVSTKYDDRNHTITFTIKDVGGGYRIRVSLYDIRGRIQGEWTLIGRGGSLGVETISIKHVPKGVFLLNAIDGNRKIQKQILKW